MPVNYTLAYQLDLGGNYLKSNYYLEEFRNPKGYFNYVKLYFRDNVFKLDMKGIKFLTESFDNQNMFVDGDGYLARHNNGIVEFFHREFKRKLNGYIGAGNVVHHKNFKKGDNRNCNLLIMNESLHKALHERITQMKIEKAQEKYYERGLRMEERFRKSYPKYRRKKARSTFNKKFFDRNPNASYRTASYHWKKFRERHNIY